MCHISLKGYDAMSPEQAILARKNLDRRVSYLRNEPLTAPPSGWIKAIREALGLTTRQLAMRLRTVPSRITAIEKAEVTGATTLKTLRETAEAMNCTFVYAIVPTTTLDQIVHDQARKKADVELARHHHTMRLEKQAMDKGDLAAERERLVAEMLSGSLRRIWIEE
jgi:predicted DNA-binding mobile mystery protein A